MPKISIIIINYNAKKTIKLCLQSVINQAWPRKEMIVIDNASTDHSLKNIKTNFPSIKIIKNTENVGYSRAANQGIRESTGDFIMIMNPDVILEPNYIEKILESAKKHPQAGAFSGKLLKYDFEHHTKNNIFDSTGLYCYRNRRIIDRGQGLEDVGQYNTEEEVFGVTGAAPIYRKEALEAVKMPLSLKQDDITIGKNDVTLSQSKGDSGNPHVMVRQAHHDTSEPHHDFEYFDEDFFMYKEDIDLAWRMRLFGWSSYYVPKAVAYHGRGTGVLKRFTHWEVAKNRRRLSHFQKSFAYKNQRLMQIKNELLQNFLRDAIHILWKEILILAYIIFREPYLLKAFIDLLRHLPRALKKRACIMSKRTATSKNMQKWFGNPCHPEGALRPKDLA